MNVITQCGKRIRLDEEQIHANGLFETARMCLSSDQIDIKIDQPSDLVEDVLVYSKARRESEENQIQRYSRMDGGFDECEKEMLKKYNSPLLLRILYNISGYLQNHMCQRFTVRAMIHYGVKAFAKA